MGDHINARRSTVAIIEEGVVEIPDHLVNDEDEQETDEEEEFDHFPSVQAVTPFAEAKAEIEEEKMTEDEEKDRGEKALSYIQGMLRRGSLGGMARGSSRRIVDWDAMPKGEEEEGDESKEAAAKEVEEHTKWYDKVADVTSCCPDLVRYLEDELEPGVVGQFAPYACKAACAHSLHSVVKWEIANVVLFIGSLGFSDSFVQSYHRTFRAAHATGVHLLKMNNLGKIFDYGIDNNHAIVLLGGKNAQVASDKLRERHSRCQLRPPFLVLKISTDANHFAHCSDQGVVRRV